MAQGQRRMIERVEPRFEPEKGDEPGPGDDDFRVTREDRPAPAPLEQRNRAPVRAKSARAKGGGWGLFGGGSSGRGDTPSRRGGGGGSGGKGRRPKRRRSMLYRLVYWSFVLCMWGLLGVGGVVAWYAAHLPPYQNLAVPPRAPNVQIVSADGSVLANRGDMGGAAISIKDLPSYVPQAFVAIEDRRFYSHFGVDPYGLGRAAFVYLTTHRATQGGSTLTQQLAKNIFLTPERSLGRKIQEAILAVELERKYTKDQILEMYINRVYFGAGAYGIEAAAQRYFHKPAKSLNVMEAATLAGLMKAPSSLAPNKYPDRARQRAQLVLDAMVDTKVITPQQEKDALATPVKVSKFASESSGNYPADWVYGLLDDLTGPLDSDVVVETTIDSKLQNTAETSLRQALDKSGAKLHVSQGALVAMDPDGAVRAMVGGRSYGDSQFNRVISAYRQPGSTFKPFVYLAALENGNTPDTVRDDAPVSLAGWSPEDFSKEYRGPVSLTTALALSLNTVAVRLCAEVGPRAVVNVAHRLGIVSNLEPNPSIALGTSEVTPFEITSAYATFANGGRLVIPYVVKRIKTDKGKVLYQRPAPMNATVIDPDKVGMMNSMMSQTLTIGTARKSALPGWQAAGKSGTSQNYRDAWFIGFTSHMVTSVWVGNDDGTSTKRITGGTLPAEIWNSFMRVAHKGVQPTPLPGKPWVHQEPQEDQVIAAQPQVDGAPDDQPVATEPVTTAEVPRSTGRPIADWLSRVLSR
ncbi:penicillin-binding protein [Labrys miyagiensis]|uniref:peptidoglycan glycosyltransferase n=2 Tax=Labrys miyagiensis TaxID=346912 RepID=A0ABQ6CJ69_9HYPH|nr:penicillin-binding protein [Labrys miyagiensis]